MNFHPLLVGNINGFNTFGKPFAKLTAVKGHHITHQTLELQERFIVRWENPDRLEGESRRGQEGEG